MAPPRMVSGARSVELPPRRGPGFLDVADRAAVVLDGPPSWSLAERVGELRAAPYRPIDGHLEDFGGFTAIERVEPVPSSTSEVVRR